MDQSGDLVVKLVLHGIGILLSLVIWFFVDKPRRMDERPGPDEVIREEKGIFGFPQINPYPLFLKKDGTYRTRSRVALIAWILFCSVLLPWITF